MAAGFIKPLAALLTLAIAPAAISQPVISHPDGEVFHSVSFPGLNQQYVHVRSEIPAGGISATVRMANWTPGSYLIKDFSSNLDRISFQSEAGEPLVFRKTSKNSWQVELAGNTSLIVEYDVHAGDLSVNTSWASHDYVLINGTSIFLYSDLTRDLPHRLRVQAPESSGRVVVPLPSTGQRGEFLASGFDELVDSPVVISDVVAHRFVDDTHEFALLNVGAGSLWDGSRSARDLRSVVKATNDFWGVVPFDHTYWFFNFLVEEGGGLEHDHSTVIVCDDNVTQHDERPAASNRFVDGEGHYLGLRVEIWSDTLQE